MTTLIIVVGVVLLINMGLMVWLIWEVDAAHKSYKRMQDKFKVLVSKIGAFEFILHHFMDPEYWPGTNPEIMTNLRPPLKKLQEQLGKSLEEYSEERFQILMRDPGLPQDFKDRVAKRREDSKRGRDNT